MTDNLSPLQRSMAMQAVRSRDTLPEVNLRRALHRLGLRFRLHRRDLPGSPDIVFPKWKAVVFVHGCFWHGHECGRAKVPKTRTEYWLAKRERNMARDIDSVKRLVESGWRVKVIWGCQLKHYDEVALVVADWLKYKKP